MTMRHIVASPEKVRLLHFGGKFRLVKDVAKEVGARAAINFGFFGMSASHPKGSWPVGQVMIDGHNLVLTGDIDHFHAVYRKDGKVRMWNWIPNDCEWGIRAGPRLIEGGAIAMKYFNDRRWVEGGISPFSMRPRVAIGLLPDGRVVLAYWDAATILQMADDLLALGCVDALAGDGGGSASWYDSKHPEDAVSKRLVPNCFIIEDEKPTTIEPPKRPESKRRLVCIDPGHGGPDPGAVGAGGIRESDVVLDIARHVGRYLSQAKVDVVFTRTDDRELAAGNKHGEELQARCDVANDAKADLFVSIHADAFPKSASVRGTRCYHYPYSKKGQAVAKTIADTMRPLVQIAGASQNMASVSFANYWVLRNTLMPAVLIETGFMTNETDLALLCEPVYRDKMALTIAIGILDALKTL